MNAPSLARRALGALFGVACLAMAGLSSPTLAADVRAEAVHALFIHEGTGVYGPLVAGRDGVYYGAASYGGQQDHGSIFRVQASGQFEVLHDFKGQPDDGDLPTGLVRGADGDFYGLTEYGGATNQGTAFRVSSGGKVELLHSFNGAVDGRPHRTLLAASDGFFYGITRSSGFFAHGSIFRMSPDGQVEQVHVFKGGPEDGDYPQGRLIEGSDGLIYGTTAYGGQRGAGTVFQLLPNGDTRILHAFYKDARNGKMPLIGVTEGPDGYFYGAAQGDKLNKHGVLYRVDSRGHFELLWNFPGDKGKWPTKELLLGRDGALYGTTAGGGEHAAGTLFRFTAAEGVSPLYSFERRSSVGSGVSSSLVEVADGEFWGANALGGTYGIGAIYRVWVTNE